jgi:hypothetical protein
MNNNFTHIITEAFSKDTVPYSDQYCWNTCSTCVPDDERPVFVAHSDSFKTPGKIAHYNTLDGWYKIVEGRNKIKIRQPKRWIEALIPETYKAYVETVKPANVITEVDTSLTTNWFENVLNKDFWKLVGISQDTYTFHDLDEKDMHHKIVVTFNDPKDATKFADMLEDLAEDAKHAELETEGYGLDPEEYFGYPTILTLKEVIVENDTVTIIVDND